jgi:hypothetical protein
MKYPRITNKDIYSQKTFYKRTLIFVALLIVGVSFWYSSRLVSQLSREERKKVSLWVEGINRRAELVKTTSILFRELEEEEHKKMELWSKATQSIGSSNSLEPNSNFLILALDIIGSNKTIPIIQTNDQDEIQVWHNIRDLLPIDKDSLSKAQISEYQHINDSILSSMLSIMKAKGNRIDVNYYQDKFLYLHYDDSYTLNELRNSFRDIYQNFISEVVSLASSTPVVFTNQSQDSIIAWNQVDTNKLKDPKQLATLLENMRSENPPITVDLGDGSTQFVFYSDSDLLVQLRYYPIVQILAIALFVLIGYWLFSIFKKSEQNKVWVGMSKETAHQLGTPLSSLYGWLQVLETKNVDQDITDEMVKDLNRLKEVTERFSKIGSKPDLKPEILSGRIESFLTYFNTRVPKKVDLQFKDGLNLKEKALINAPLFDWVLENLCKNSIDAMEGRGKLTITTGIDGQRIFIDVSDTGKGISVKDRGKVFQPGYTSKQRGWGLGLSLSRRIVKDYHNGRIFLKSSESGAGSTFRILLNRV